MLLTDSPPLPFIVPRAVLGQGWLASTAAGRAAAMSAWPCGDSACCPLLLHQLPLAAWVPGHTAA